MELVPQLGPLLEEELVGAVEAKEEEEEEEVMGPGKVVWTAVTTKKTSLASN